VCDIDVEMCVVANGSSGISLKWGVHCWRLIQWHSYTSYCSRNFARYHTHWRLK